ncbi:MAG: DUF6503 family protein [Vicingaceae bacterium]
MRQIVIYFFILSLSTFSCQQKQSAEQIVNQTIEYAGGEKFEQSKIAFSFRDKHYEVHRNESEWKMRRTFQDSSLLVEDDYSPKGFKRKINGAEAEVADSMAFKYVESINSVIYFALLPYKLNDPAVIKENLGKELVEGKPYYKIKVRFKEEGGGEDFQDEFIYWFDQKDYSLDYLAYSFQVNGGGMRFRKAYNERFLNGIRFVDYINYKPLEGNVTLTSLAQLWQINELEELSKIKLEDVAVSLKPS